MQGALEMRNKTVEDKYTPLEKVYMLDINSKLDHGTMKEVNYSEFLDDILQLSYRLTLLSQGSQVKYCGGKRNLPAFVH